MIKRDGALRNETCGEGCNDAPAERSGDFAAERCMHVAQVTVDVTKKLTKIVYLE